MCKRELYFISGSPPCWSVMLALGVKGIKLHSNASLELQERAKRTEASCC